jgi:hypothetical protein
MSFKVGLQTLVRRRARLEREYTDVPPFSGKENRSHPDIGADVEHAIAVGQLNAVLQVAARAEHFAVHETRLVGVQGKHFQISWKREQPH